MKIQIDETGLYQLTYDELRECGFSDPSHVAVFGYGGAMLSEDFSTEYVDDLPQIPVLHTGNKLIFMDRGYCRGRCRMAFLYVPVIHIRCTDIIS